MIQTRNDPATVLGTVYDVLKGIQDAVHLGDIDEVERLVERQGALLEALRSLATAPEEPVFTARDALKREEDLAAAYAELAEVNYRTALLLQRSLVLVGEELGFLRKLETPATNYEGTGDSGPALLAAGSKVDRRA